jgi:hypothetical protein
MTVRGVYRNGKVELDHPLDIPDGTSVEVDVRPTEEEDAAEGRADDRMIQRSGSCPA